HLCQPVPIVPSFSHPLRLCFAPFVRKKFLRRLRKAKMKIKIVRNYDAFCRCGSSYDEGAIIQQTLLEFGHASRLANPSVGLNGDPLGNDEFVIVATQPERNNGP